MNDKDHWDNIYTTRSAGQVGWYTPHLQTSLSWINDLKLPVDAPVIDVGGGASTLVDDLLEAGHEDITVLDLSESALDVSRGRLTSKPDSVSWLQGDITQISLPSEKYQLWHDRAVFHFLTEPRQRQKYQQTMSRALKPGGFLVIGAFSPAGPERCSGLPVQRYNSEQLSAQFGDSFKLIRHQYEIHRTPSEIEQAYVYCLLEKTN